METEERSDEIGVDLPELLARVENDRELLREVFEIFLEEFPQLHTELNAALGESDLKKVQVAAHTLKGMFASLSFGGASSCAHRIERMATEGKAGAIPEELARMDRSAARAQAELASVCCEVVG